MQFFEASLAGVYIIELEKFEDDRGFFARAFCRREFEKHGLSADFVQANLSFNRRKNTLRGLHYQIFPHEEVKLVRCLRGRLFDVVVDLRTDSGTYLKWLAVELDAERRNMIYIPQGFAHGYMTLVDDTEVFYQVSAYYAPEAEKGIRWDDPQFRIDWPRGNGLIISEKDVAWPNFEAQKD
jgi:dTDP-4-dehydrorhamnose 3,5-epimerase